VLLVEGNGGLGDAGCLGGLDVHAFVFERLSDFFEIGGGRVDVDRAVAHLDVFGPGVDGVEGDVVGILAVGGDGDDASILEVPRDGAGLAEVAARAGEDVAHLGDDAVAVVGRDLDEDRGAVRAVALVGDLGEIGAVAAAHRALDGALDVVGGHVVLFGLLDGEAEARVAGGVSAAGLGGDDDLFRELREDLAALCVGDALLPLDRGPL
jgi:hypothetical protein